MIHRGTYDGTIYYNPANKFCIISVKTAEKDVPEEARSIRRRKDHLIRFVATGYELPRTDAVELELDGEWKKGKYGMQLQVEQWHEIVPQTKSGVEGYLASGLIKGIGPALAKQIVSRFGVETLDILQNRPERLLEIKGITENKLEAIKTSYAESRMLQDLMTLLSPFKITPKTAQKIYQFFGPASVDILKKSPFELCQISGFGFLRVDAIVQKNGGDLRAPMRIKGALFWALEDSKGKNGHLFLTSEALQKEALQLLNAKIPIPSLRLHAQEVSDVLEDMILHGEVVSVKGDIYLPRVFAQEDETARRIAMRVVEPPAPEKIEQILEQVKREIGLALSSKQEAAVYATYRHNLSIITGSPGTGKTTVLKTILEVYRRLHPQGEIALMAPTGRASRRMAESTGVDKAKTLHSILGLASEEDEIKRNNTQEPLSADLIIVDEFSMVDMWLANKFFSRIKGGARVILVGDPDQLPSVGAGNVFRELIDCGLITVTVLDQIFRQSKDSLIAYNAKFINEARQAEKKKAEQEQLERLAAMSDDEVVNASMQRVNADTEKLTRRNMKECVAEFIQTKCLEDIAFARLTMHPRKSMIHCFQYISRKAWDYIQDELKASGIQPGPGSQGYGCDVPDDLCYQWAEDYFRDPDAKEDHKEEEKFVPNPYYGKDFARTTKKKQKEKKKAEAKPKPVQKEKPANDGQLSLLDLGMTKAG